MRIALALLVILAAGAATTGERTPVYGQQERHVIFSHLGHEQIGCEDCHAKERIPGHAQCGRCHKLQDGREGRQSSCGQCHRPESGAPRAESRARGSLKFTHSLHRESPERCRSCHNPERESGPTGMLPRAGECFSCHTALMENRRCDACHAAHPDGRLKLRLDQGSLLPRGGHAGDNHDLDWKTGHGRTARVRRESCRSCHTVRSCDECHRGVLRDLEIHPPDWDLSHPGSARAGLLDCERCHRDQSRCLGCHRHSGVAESSGLRPRNMRLHPQGYDSSHSGDARRNLRACSACHAESDCIRCHGVRGIGQAVSPHPAGFGGRCRLLKQRNSRPCLKCHGTSDLEARCP